MEPHSMAWWCKKQRSVLIWQWGNLFSATNLNISLSLDTCRRILQPLCILTQGYNGYIKVNIHSLPSLLLINGHGYRIQLNGMETRVPHLSFMKCSSPGKLQNEDLFHSILSNSFPDNPCIYLSRSLWPVHHSIHQRELSPFGSLLSPCLKGNCYPDWAKATSTEK